MADKKRIAIAGCQEFLNKSSESSLLVSALNETGHSAEVFLWDHTSAFSLSCTDYLLLGAWNYPDKTAQFIEWSHHAASTGRLINPLPFILWNLDKHYLFDLAAGGCQIAPTLTVPPGMTLPVMKAPYVIKPAISNAARNTAMYLPGRDNAAVQHVADIHQAGGTALLQTYIPEIEDQGEISMIYFNGKFSHAIRKSALLSPDAGLQDNLFFQATFTGHQPDRSQQHAGWLVMDTLYRRFGRAPVYARIDLVAVSPTLSLVMECELIEPMLFLRYDRKAVNRLVQAILV